ncbi:hypothetical protein CC1G_01311 [Coprinopsis cinerea okayama7|uniref:DNA replication checkpoint mediator MRC1 domain-containing protein n=1 Tax=Coprinopsis cinerea (strain Okayama-7 / 130 / ATCC MYA-4618 / FGSC 9003) TaxID=240176 RepID=A8NYD3_COPC7|nr:hypothetical protein CC1G_01311 [Coprinopsis cinerea okayama7\|eukprot:XP_001837399.2 hypothetical protein CC1G_01311 [Coprinopsis cinerea okayama7\
MPLDAHSSLIPDSTASNENSPIRDASSPPVVKRAVRTYGRKKTPPPASQSDASFDAASSLSTRSVYHTAPPNLDDQVKESSDNDNDSDEGDGGGFQFTWQKTLARMDKEDRDNEQPPKRSTTSGFGPPSLLGGITRKDNLSLSSNQEMPVEANDIFSSSSPRRHPTETPRGRRRSPSVTPLFLNADDESDSGNPPPSSINGNTLTPRSDVSSTPPTTDGEPSMSRSSRGKGKQRSLEELRASITPPDSPSTGNVHQLPGGKPRKSKTKRPTKKDREEIRKERARIAENKDVSITSASRKEFKIQDLLETIKPADSTPGSKLQRESSSLLDQDPIMNPSSPEPSNALSGGMDVDILSAKVPGPSKLSPTTIPDVLDDSDEDLPESLTEHLKPRPKAEAKSDLHEIKMRALAAANQRKQIDSDDDDDLEIVPAQKVDAPPRSTEKRARGRKSLPIFARRAVTQPRDRFEQELLARAAEESAKLSELKKQAWIQAGGRVLEEIKPEGGPESVLRAYAEKALKAIENNDNLTKGEDDEDESDGEWKPEERGSASPSSHTMDIVDEGDSEGEDAAMGSEAEGEDGQDDENIAIPRGHRRRTIVDSDEENDENASLKRVSRPARRSISLDEDLESSSVGHDAVTPFSEDGTDKENNAGLLFDRSEDKENKSIARFDSFDSFDDISPRRLGGPSSSGSRQPFQELPGPTDTPKPINFASRANLTELFEAQLSEPRRTPELSPVFGSKSREGFSQFSPTPVVGRALEEEFFDPTQKESQPASLLGEAFGEKPLRRALGRNDSLDFTQEFNLEPSFQPREEILRKANDIVEKEQELKLDAVRHAENKPQLYVNEDGESPSERSPKANEKKRRNAFDMLGQGAHAEAERKRRKLDKSEFVEDEADESDDDAGFWGRPKKDDDEEMENDEDLDKTLETLVDDQEMDDQTLAEERVREKFKEQEQQEDEKLEKIAHNVVEGEFRKRKKDGGFNLSDESDDDDEDENRKARRRLRRQQKNREDVLALTLNPETHAFAQTYNAALKDDDETLEFLAQDQTEEILASLDRKDDDEEDMEDMDEDEVEPETVTMDQIRRAVQERARERAENPNYEDESIDLYDTAWVEDNEDDEDDVVQVKTVVPGAKKAVPTRPRGTAFDLDMDDLETQETLRPEMDEHRLKKQQTWAVSEARNHRNASTARSGRGAAVTSVVRAKCGGGSLRVRPQDKGERSGSQVSKPVKKTASVLDASVFACVK